MTEKCEECGQEDCTCEEMSTEDLAETNHVLVNALIDMLIEKKVISEEEFNKKLDSFKEVEE